MSQASDSAPLLSVDDLIPDGPLDQISDGPIGDDLDLLHHRQIARRVAELARTRSGQVNIALFGPWGSGKSSFLGLLREELQTDDARKVLMFNAWKNAGEAFHANFLSEIAFDLKNPNSEDIAKRLFQSSRRVQIRGLRWTEKHPVWAVIAAVSTGLFMLLGLPAIVTLVQNANDSTVAFWPKLISNVIGFSGASVSGTILLVLLAAIIELSKVSLEEAAPSAVSQFGALFDEVLGDDDGTRFVIVIDELDRCSPKDVIQTLEGLRTFLDNKRCVFVVAFDREAISSIIKNQLGAVARDASGNPYYQTSGEYLDKIFQYQVSLPPQRVHMARRYALSLVEHREGIWRELRTKSPEWLSRVVRILSPIHLTSPRRTKVLLNDFAINARIYQGLGIDWLGRADEIAVYTVIQTEFPRLAADLEREPTLLDYLASGNPPERAALRALYETYQDPKNDVELDDFRGTTKDNDAAKLLRANLDAYLRKLAEDACPLPQVDLILMHHDENLLAFQDPAIFNAIVQAGDAPRADTLELLRTASERDRLSSIRYLIEESEQESLDISALLIGIAGEVAGSIASIPADLAAQLLNQWPKVAVPLAPSTSAMTRGACLGFAAAAVVAGDREQIEGLLEAIDGTREVEWMADAVDRLLLQLDDSRLARVIGPLTSYASSILDTSPHLLDDVLLAANRLPAEAVSPDIFAPILERLAATGTPPTRATASTVPTAPAAPDPAIVAIRDATSGVENIWSDLVVDGVVRDRFLAFLRAVGKTKDNTWALDLHDSLVDQEVRDQQPVLANRHLLLAIIDMPIAAAQRWTIRLQTRGVASADLAAQALRKTLDRALDSSLGRAARQNGAANAAAIASLPLDDPIDLKPFVALIQTALDAEPIPFEADVFAVYHALVAGLHPLALGDARVSSLVVQVYRQTLSQALDTQDLSPVLTALAREKTEITEPLRAELSGELGEMTLGRANWLIRALLLAQRHAKTQHARFSGLSWSVLASLIPTADWTQVTAEWIPTGPPIAEIRAAIKQVNAASLPADAWATYATTTNATNRTEIWRRLVAAGASKAHLRAIASGGVAADLYRQLADQIVEEANRDLRAEALEQFLTLPAGRPLIPSILERLQKKNRVGDVPLGFRLLQAIDGDVSNAQKKKLGERLQPWIQAGAKSKSISKAELRYLEDAGLYKSNFFQRLLG